MNQVQHIRKRVVDGLSRELDKLCGYISTIDGNRTCVELLKGRAKVDLLADMTELVMVHLGRVNEITRQHEGTEVRSASQSRRYVRGV